MNFNLIEQHLILTRNLCKEGIVRLITLIYLKHNGDFPNWEEDEEIVVENTEIGATSRISVEVSNTFDESTYTEKWAIEEYHINVSGDLYFCCNDTLEEVEWTDVLTEELVAIYTRLFKYWEKIK